MHFLERNWNNVALCLSRCNFGVVSGCLFKLTSCVFEASLLINLRVALRCVHLTLLLLVQVRPVVGTLHSVLVLTSLKGLVVAKAKHRICGILDLLQLARQQHLQQVAP